MRRSQFLSFAVLALAGASGLALAVPPKVAAPVLPALPASNRLMVKVDPGVSPAFLAAGWGLRPLRALASDPTTWVMQAATPARAAALVTSLATARGVVRVIRDVRVRIAREQFTPNDPFFFPDQPVAGWPGQWYLHNPFVAGRDINVSPAWARGITGVGTLIGLVDDGVQANHPDLSFNYSSSNSRDFGQADNDPSPVSNLDNHGTAVAGLMAARGGNSIGITGVAPNAAFAALRIDFDGATGVWLSQAIDATLWRSSGANVNIKVKNHSYGPLVAYDSLLQPAADAMVTSAASGTIHVRSAGNARGTTTQDVNTSAERATPASIAVAALGSDGIYAAYSNFGAAVAACTPSSASRGSTFNLLTTDRTGESAGYNGSDSFPNADYTSNFGGTSGAAPLMTGALALARQVNPNLDVRLAKHLLARTSRTVDATDTTESGDGGWRTNGAGFRFNQNYGWGLVNADALTLAAADWRGVTPLTTWSTGTIAVGALIPDGNLTGLVRRFTTPATGPLEEVEVSLRATHSWRGDLEAYLTSPSGFKSRLFYRGGGDSEANLDWTFTSLAFWGENPAGQWTLSLRDVFSADTGTWNTYSVNLRMGQPTPAQRTLAGNVLLEDWAVSPSGQTVELSLVNAGGTTVETLTDTLDANGNYSVTTAQEGSFMLVAKSTHWLTARRTGLDLTGPTPGVSNLDFTLVNGDIDGDNAITVFDYDYLSSNFDRTSADADWNTPDAAGISPRFSDLDGDDAVTVFDYDILSKNFDRTGLALR